MTRSPIPAEFAASAIEPEATERQRAFIASLLQEREMTAEQATKARQMFLAGLTKSQASRWIERLLELPKRQRLAPVKYDASDAPTFPEVPAGRYAIREDGVTKFYRVDRPTEGRWAGYTFLSVQASDDLHAIKNRETKATILAAIAKDPAAASKLYGTELGSCGVCGRTLTDETSRAYGIGPVCRENTGW